MVEGHVPQGSASSILVLGTTNVLQIARPDGEIGRRAGFRDQLPQGSAGSTPVLGTKNVRDASSWLRPFFMC